MYGTQGTPATTNTPSARFGAQAWRDGAGHFWLFGGSGYGLNVTNAGAPDVLNDLWMFDPATTKWTWMSGTDVVATPGVYGTLGTPAAGNLPGGRGGGMVWTDSAGQVWLFGGIGVGSVSGARGLAQRSVEFQPDDAPVDLGERAGYGELQCGCLWDAGHRRARQPAR